ncbi:molybdenum cofactor guanylyltransferase [Demequina iriomotensis]|uniref:molybdenum cofactor guanylyltransferase n=1 Tax=Demequina iriomotensis TaxID=1536641 RepID=UPI0009E380AA|nr:NTP transferase domain-containing protein [Demequina iriomotensis]
MGPGWDSVIVAGGRGSRLGGVSKPDLEVGGRALLDRALDAVSGAAAVVIVGGPRRDGVRWTVESPAGSGPAAAVAAGLAELSRGRVPSAVTVVLGVDTPRAAEVVPALLAAASITPEPVGAAPGVDERGVVEPGVVAPPRGAWIVDAAGFPQPLLAAYPTAPLAARCVGDLEGTSLRRLVSGVEMVTVADVDGASRDLDTWDDAQYWKERMP